MYILYNLTTLYQIYMMHQSLQAFTWAFVDRTLSVYDFFITYYRKRRNNEIFARYRTS